MENVVPLLIFNELVTFSYQRLYMAIFGLAEGSQDLGKLINVNTKIFDNVSIDTVN